MSDYRKIFHMECQKVPGRDSYIAFMVVAYNEKEARDSVTKHEFFDQPIEDFKATYVGIALAKTKSGVIMADFDGV